MPKPTPQEIYANQNRLRSTYMMLTFNLQQFSQSITSDRRKKVAGDILNSYGETFRSQRYALMEGPKSLEPKDMVPWINSCFALAQVLNVNSLQEYLPPELQEMIKPCDDAVKLVNKWNNIFYRHGQFVSAYPGFVFDKEGNIKPENKWFPINADGGPATYLGNIRKSQEKNGALMNRLREENEAFRKKQLEEREALQEESLKQPAKFSRQDLLDINRKAKEDNLDLVERLHELPEERVNEGEDSRTYENMAEAIFSDYRKDFTEQLPAFLAGPKATDKESICMWLYDGFETYKLLSSKGFLRFTDHPDRQIREFAEDAVKLGDYWTELVEDPQKLSAAFDEQGNIKDKAVENKISDLVNAAKQRFERVKEDPSFQKLREKKPEKETTSVDRMIHRLQKLQKELKDTDPIWMTTNSGSFKQLKSELSGTIRALQDFKRHPVKNQLTRLNEKLESLKNVSDVYSRKKEEDYATSHKDRDGRRHRIASDIFDFTKNAAEITVRTQSMYETGVSLSEKIASLRQLRTASQLNSPHLSGGVLNAVQAMKKFPEAEVVKSSRLSGLKADLAKEISGIMSAMGKEEADSFMSRPELKGIKKDLTALKSQGDKLLAGDEKKTRKRNDALVRPDSGPAAGAQ